MLYKFYGCVIFVWLLSAGLFYQLFFVVGEKDRSSYMSFMQKKEETTRHIGQNRSGVRKDLFLIKDHERHHIRIESEHSFLYYSPKETQLVEELHQIRCLIEDHLTPQGMQIQQLKSDQGTYLFSDHCFRAQEVEMTLLNTLENPFEKTTFPATVLLDGIAKGLILTLKEEPTLIADQFKAKVSSQIIPGEKRILKRSLFSPYPNVTPRPFIPL